MKKIITICFLFLSFIAFAQTPQKISYQGVARAITGSVIANQAIGLRISLHSASLTGTVVYKETHLVTTNTFGLFTIEIGDGTVVSGNFGNINWGTNTYYVQVEMDPAGGSSYADMGTSQLISVPYALYAETAATAENAVTYWSPNGNHIYNNNSGNVGIGTTTPSNLLVVENNSNSGESRNLVLINNKSTGDRSVAGIKINAGSTQDAEKFMLLQFHSETYNLAGNYNDYGQVWSSGNGLILRAADFNGSPSNIRFQTNLIPPANGSYDRMVITHEGNIGIGTITPETRLQLTGGDFYIENNTNGVIMKSPNGQCWKMTVDNTGQITTTSVTCP